MGIYVRVWRPLRLEDGNPFALQQVRTPSFPLERRLTVWQLCLNSLIGLNEGKVIFFLNNVGLTSHTEHLLGLGKAKRIQKAYIESYRRSWCSLYPDLEDPNMQSWRIYRASIHLSDTFGLPLILGSYLLLRLPRQSGQPIQ